MKIAEIRTHLLEHKLDTAFESASMRFDKRVHLLVEVICEDGTTGWGEALGPAGPNAAAIAVYAGWLKGMNALETEKVWATLYNALRDQGQRGVTVTALSAIDIALWRDARQRRFQSVRERKLDDDSMLAGVEPLDKRFEFPEAGPGRQVVVRQLNPDPFRGARLGANVAGRGGVVAHLHHCQPRRAVESGDAHL